MRRKINQIKRPINGSKLEIAIVVSEFNRDVTNGLLKSALETLWSNKVKDNNIKILWVPGSFEIPLACQKLTQTKKFDGLIALGCIIKGETDHCYYIAKETSRGVMDVILKYEVPIGFGIITANNLKQAKARSSGKHNKGAEAALAVLEMIELC